VTDTPSRREPKSTNVSDGVTNTTTATATTRRATNAANDVPAPLRGATLHPPT
jgi:hypothetical protein